MIKFSNKWEWNWHHTVTVWLLIYVAIQVS